MVKITLRLINRRKVRKFYFFLPFYKSFLCRRVKWKLISDDNQIKQIEQALNIKSRKKRIPYIYDKACAEVDKEMNKIKNLCGFQHNQCYVQRCQKKEEINGCCKSCKYQSTNGCLTKNLACKLFFCSEVKKIHHVVKFKDLKILKMLSISQRLVLKAGYFSSKEDILKDLFYGSLITGTIRIYSRLLKQLKK